MTVNYLHYTFGDSHNHFKWDESVRAEVARVRAFAESSGHWYRPGSGAPAPGHDDSHVVMAGTNRAVFSWTVVPEGTRGHQTGLVLRHLSVSVEGEGRYPLPLAVWTLAHHFGFTGASPDSTCLVWQQPSHWVFAPDEKEQCITVQEPIEPGGMPS